MADYPRLPKDFVPLGPEAGIYYAKGEVTNAEYHLFLTDIARRDSAIWEKCNYDSTKWVTGSDAAAPALRQVYHSHPSFREYPIVNITAYAAGQYCDWLNESAAPGVRYRLPTLAEQRILIGQVDTSSLHLNKSGGQVRPSFANLQYRVDGVEDYAVDGATYTAPVSAFVQNRQQATSVIGNVSEMNSHGSRTGGGWNESPTEALAVSEGEAAGPHIGFRVFAEVTGLPLRSGTEQNRFLR